MTRVDPLVAVAALCGAGVGLGLVLVVVGLRGVDPAAPSRVGRWWARLDARRWRHSTRRLALALGVAVGAGAVTRWPAGAVLAGLAAWALPGLLGRDREHERRLARIEAIATWTEMLRDTLAAAAGLEQAILATAPTAPAPIRAEVSELAARLERGDRLGAALREFAERLGDPIGDLVVAALVLAAEQHARQLGDLLSSLAAAAREQAGMRMRIAAGRARTRTSIRVIVTTTLAMAAGLIVLNRDYLSPYDTPAGQLVLLLVGGLFAAAFWWLSRIGRIGEPARFLTHLPAPPDPARTGGPR